MTGFDKSMTSCDIYFERGMLIFYSIKTDREINIKHFKEVYE